MKEKIIRNKKQIIIFVLITVLSIAIRLINIDFVSGDYKKYLSKWIQQIRKPGGIANYYGNYNLPYIYILSVIAHLHRNSLYLVKVTSMLFDYILAILGAILVYQIKKDKKYFLGAYAIIILLPTVILNSSTWAQCDSIYVSFVIASLIFLIQKKYKIAFVLLGIAVSFKLQAIFIMPLYILLWSREKQIKWYYFGFIPLVSFIMFIPSIIGGYGQKYMNILVQNIKNTSATYTCANFPNVYNWLCTHVDNRNYIVHGNNEIILSMILILVISMILVFIYFNRKKVKFTPNLIIEVGLLLSLLCTFLLPGMHDRYNYLAEILSILYVLLNGIKKLYIPIFIIGSSMISYIEYLYHITLVNMVYVTGLIFFVIITMMIQLIRKLNMVAKDNIEN